MQSIRTYAFDTLVIGAGCAGLNAAERLHALGQTSIALLTENRLGGTSRNTGSDKQTYYKLTLSGDTPDSVGEMARTLFEGGCVDGDHALAEAALSAPCFLRLAELGVAFPHNGFGEYVGYKTDHDPRTRATSAGPLTSKLMTEALERAVAARGIRVYDKRLAVRLLLNEGKIRGALCLNTEENRFELFAANHVVCATGGPAGIYRDSSYPAVHFGMSGIALEAGASGKNLTEWQYGLASLSPRWNVSGTYMQALPRFVSTDASGGDAREFLSEALPDVSVLLSLTFLKGYQWPFDVRKAMDGSSLIDLLVYKEMQLGRRVYLDFTRNPCGEAFSLSALSGEAMTYLTSAEALLDTPFERLLHMNAPAVAFYRSHGVELSRDWLPIALCSQHHNGGLSVDESWQTAVEGLYAVGEVAGTHGVARPGGSALNAGQAGSTQAARAIAARKCTPPSAEDTAALFEKEIAEMTGLAQAALLNKPNVRLLMEEAMGRMSRYAGPVRDTAALPGLMAEASACLCGFSKAVGVSDASEWPLLFRLRDMLITQQAVLFAMQDYAAQGMGSRGAGLYTDPMGHKPLSVLPEACRFRAEAGPYDRVQEVAYKDGALRAFWRRVRPIPEPERFFENVWRSYRDERGEG